MKNILAIILSLVAGQAFAQNQTVLYPRDLCQTIVSQTSYPDFGSKTIMRFDILCLDNAGVYRVLSDTWQLSGWENRQYRYNRTNPRTFTLVPYDGDSLRFE